MPFWTLFGTFGGLWGASGHPWGTLGPLWGTLGAFWEVSFVMSVSECIFDGFGGPRGVPKGRPAAGAGELWRAGKTVFLAQK